MTTRISLVTLAICLPISIIFALLVKFDVINPDDSWMMVPAGIVVALVVIGVTGIEDAAKQQAEPPANPGFIQGVLDEQYPAPPGANFEQWMDEYIQAYPEEPEMVLAMWEKRMLDAGYEFADEVEEGYSALVWKDEGRAHVIKYRITTQETDPDA